MRFSTITLPLILLLFLQFTVRAQEWTSYQSPQQINDLVDTGDQLYLATDAGLVVMNKSSLDKTVYNTSNSSLSNNHIQTIALAPDGNLWIGTYDVVLSRFNGSNFLPVTGPDETIFYPNTILYDMEFAPNGDLWMGTSDGVFKKQDQTWNRYDQNELGPLFLDAWDIEIGSDNSVYIASQTIHKHANGTWVDISVDAQLTTYIDAEIFISTTGELYYVGSSESKVGRYDGQNWQVFETYNPAHFDVPFSVNQIIGFAEDASGLIYLNTRQNGLYKLVGSSWQQVDDPQAAAYNNHTAYLHIDNQNNHWLNNTIYLSVNRNGTIESTRISDFSIENNSIRKVKKGPEGEVYFIPSDANNRVAMLAPDNNWTSIELPVDAVLWPGSGGDFLWKSQDDMWAAAFEGYYHFNGSEWAFTSALFCQSILPGPQDKTYIRALDKIYIIGNGSTTEYSAVNSPLADGLITGHGVDAAGNLWVAVVENGTGTIQKVTPGGNWTTYTAAQHPAITWPAGDFYFDMEGNVWVPEKNEGALRFDGNTWSNPLLDNSSEINNLMVYSIQEDAVGRLYFAHNSGVTTLFEGEWGNLEIESIPGATSIASSIAIDNEGIVWWASNQYGAFAYTPETTNTVIPGNRIKSLFSVFPNPASDYIILDFSTTEPTQAQLRLYNQLGQILSTFELGTLQAGTHQHPVNLVHLPKGNYFIQLFLNGNSSTIQLLVH